MADHGKCCLQCHVLRAPCFHIEQRAAAPWPRAPGRPRRLPIAPPEKSREKLSLVPLHFVVHPQKRASGEFMGLAHPACLPEADASKTKLGRQRILDAEAGRVIVPASTTDCVCVFCVTFRRRPGRLECLKKHQDTIMLNNKTITTVSMDNHDPSLSGPVSGAERQRAAAETHGRRLTHQSCRTAPLDALVCTLTQLAEAASQCVAFASSDEASAYASHWDSRAVTSVLLAKVGDDAFG